MSAVKVARPERSCFVSSCRMSHLGKKPVRGGRPPRERSMRGARAMIMGVFVQEVERVLMEEASFVLNVRNSEVVMIM